MAAGGGAYDVTVTAPVGNSYNGLSFTFLGGTASAGGAGSQPQWVFPITGATADNAQITSVTCGGTTAVPNRNTGSTGAATNYIQNLTVSTAAPPMAQRQDRRGRGIRLQLFLYRGGRLHSHRAGRRRCLRQPGHHQGFHDHLSRPRRRSGVAQQRNPGR
ncbi:MAG: hypothetical protein IPK39_16555 [Sulfuritalea sp.]|nr:hypothetical protein [Sulfuritalea sp.]